LDVGPPELSTWAEEAGEMIHHYDIGPKPVQFGVTSKEGILNQGRNLSFTEPSRATLSPIEDRVKFREQFLVLIKFKLRDLVSRCFGIRDLAFN